MLKGGLCAQFQHPSCTQSRIPFDWRVGSLSEMAMKLREVTWIRLLSLLLWTILVMVKRAATQLIEVVEVWVFDDSERNLERGEQEEDIEGRTLLPPLSDELVLGRIWPLLHRRVNISLLWRLRRVNRAWKKNVGTTVEWAALEMVRIDSLGLLQYLAVRHELRPSLRERVEDELRALTVLLTEQWVSYRDRPEIARSWAGRLEPAIGRSGSWLPVRELTSDSQSEWASHSCSSRETARSCYSVDSTGRSGENSDRTEEEEIEAYASSTDSSMGVYYPRHWLRN